MFRSQTSPIAILSLVGCTAILLSGCPKPTTHYSDPTQFARALFRIADEGDEDAWGTMLTKARRAQGHIYVHEHFQKYQKLVMELEEGAFGGELAKAKFRIEEGALEFEYENKWATIFRVEMEDGGWKVNQD